MNLSDFLVIDQVYMGALVSDVDNYAVSSPMIAVQSAYGGIEARYSGHSDAIIEQNLLDLILVITITGNNDPILQEFPRKRNQIKEQVLHHLKQHVVPVCGIFSRKSTVIFEHVEDMQ